MRRSIFPIGILILVGSLLPFFQSSAQTVPASQAPSTDGKSGDPAAVIHEAHKLSQAGKFDEAVARLEALAADQPGSKGLAHELGLAYYKKGDYSRATEALKRATSEDPSDNEAVQLLGLSYYLSGHPADAIAPLEKVQTWFPSVNVDASYILGMCYLQTKDYPSARRSFGRMFGVAPDSAAAYLFTARMLLRSDFGPIAEEYGQKAVSLDPKLPLAHQLLGELYTYQSKIPEAIAQFEQELALNPGNAQVYYKLADAYSRIQKFEDAERLLQRAIWLDPSSSGPYILLGKVLAKKGEYALAARALERSIAMDPNNAIPHHLLGQAYRELGRTEEAERELQLAQKLQSGTDQNP
jgi:tetratricopeptide (TPR) repeat protein